MSIEYVLDRGYVRVRDAMGNDDSVVDAARISFDKLAANYTREQNKRLLKYLAEHGHWSPFSHVYVQLEIKAPVMVVNQLVKHRIGGRFQTDAWDDGYNELSRRYVTEELEFYMPETWRLAPKNKKQGSGADADDSLNRDMQIHMENAVSNGVSMYEQALEKGVAPEQARLFLPYAAMYTKVMWTPSLATVARFCMLREKEDAQFEIQQYGRAIHKLVEPLFPQSFDAFGMFENV